MGGKVMREMGPMRICTFQWLDKWQNKSVFTTTKKEKGIMLITPHSHYKLA